MGDKNNKGPDKSCNTYPVIIIPLSLFTSPLPSHTLCVALYMRRHILLHLSLLNPEFPKLLSGKASPQAYVLLYIEPSGPPSYPATNPFAVPVYPCHRLRKDNSPVGDLVPVQTSGCPQRWSSWHQPTQLGGPMWAPVPSTATLNITPEEMPHPKMNTEESFLNSSRI